MTVTITKPSDLGIDDGLHTTIQDDIYALSITAREYKERIREDLLMALESLPNTEAPARENVEWLALHYAQVALLVQNVLLEDSVPEGEM